LQWITTSWLDLFHDGPEKADEFSRHRNGGDLRLLPIGEVMIQLV